MLAGFGHVGRAFLSLLRQKAEALRSLYDLELRLQALIKSDGGLFLGSGPDSDGIPDLAAGSIAARADWKRGLTVKAGLEGDRPGVFVECTPSNIRSGEPGLGYIRTALTAGWHVATANKAPLAADFQGLANLARDNHLDLKFSAATAAALPTLDIGLYSLAGADVLSIEGILNGTTNFILSKMGEGVSYKSALKEAQARGIAERNPALDVEGWDTAVKLLLIANCVLRLNLTLQDIQVEGITRIKPDRLRRASKEGRALKLIGKISRVGDRWEAKVSPEVIDRTHSLFGVGGTNKGITFLTDTMGSITVSGGKSDPRGAAAALLKDIIHIFRG